MSRKLDGFATRTGSTRDALPALLVGLAIVYAIFQGVAHGLGSDRGQGGLLVAAVVVGALLAVERLFFRQPPIVALRCLGFGRPADRGMAIALGLCLMLVAVLPVYAVLRGATVVPDPGWMWLLPGLAAQAGVAEEALFRGYLFGRLRRGRSFWRAAVLAAVPFVLVHLTLFATLPWPIALASVLLATVISFPLAHLFELGGRTIWPPALLHVTVQGAIKVLDVPGEAATPVVWMIASAAIPWLAFCFARPGTSSANGAT